MSRVIKYKVGNKILVNGKVATVVDVTASGATLRVAFSDGSMKNVQATTIGLER